MPLSLFSLNDTIYGTVISRLPNQMQHMQILAARMLGCVLKGYAMAQYLDKLSDTKVKTDAKIIVPRNGKRSGQKTGPNTHFCQISVVMSIHKQSKEVSKSHTARLNIIQFMNVCMRRTFTMTTTTSVLPTTATSMMSRSKITSTSFGMCPCSLKLHRGSRCSRHM